MNRRSIRAIVLAASAIAMLAAMAVSSAGAAEWRSNGGSFTGTSGTSTLTSGSSSISCSAATATGTLAGTTGPVYPSKWTAVTNGTVIFKPCAVAGVTLYSVHCAYSLVATSHAPTTIGAHPFGGEQTAGDVGVSCGVFLGNTLCRNITGSLGGDYSNPATTNGTSKLNVTGGNLTVSGTQNCALSAGTGSYSGQVFHIASGPSIWVL
jgi:hypothetical protein